ncbi:hypothetical protein Srubr_02090 [Streptomyces rubradiris]|uniref:Recombination endonuclease VII n=1 Tax=Streptomyces rubradiris TaxID=285531 RepID=A0ABQ3R3D2_STRRR|nr:hypothetical protein GCM10018792_75820 [Streptomyces rubradiris]GHI50363.1 hypothetical protein Srubr_02090 [Streptomyces rubradiris]
MSSRKRRRIITCDACGKRREHGGHGWCRTCLTRWVYHGRPADGPPPALSPAPCGTDGAYQRHLRKGEEPCQACRDAHAAKQRSYTRRHSVSSHWSREEAQAAVAVAARSKGVADCRLVLEALGLAPSGAAHRDHVGRAA